MITQILGCIGARVKPAAPRRRLSRPAACYPRSLRTVRDAVKIKSLLLLFALLFAVSALAQNAHFDGQTWWNHIKVLADDKLEGRDTGSRGEREAQKYAIEQLKNAGAEPAGSQRLLPAREVCLPPDRGKGLQPRPDPRRQTRTAHAGRRRHHQHARSCPPPRSKRRWSSSAMVLRFPEKNYDDFAGLDLHGKIIVIFSGSPSEIPGPLASHYQTAAERWKVLRAAGAIGIVALMNPAFHGHSLVPHRAQPGASDHGSRLSRVQRNRRRETRRHRQSGQRGKVFCRLGPYLRGNRRAGQRSQAAAAFSAGRFAGSKNKSRSHQSRVGQPRRQIPRQRSHAEG